MKKMLFIIATLGLLGWSSTLGWSSSQAGKPQLAQNVNSRPHQTQLQKPAQAKSYKGMVASLSIDKEEYKSGESMEATLTFTATTEGHRLFNPFFHGLLDKPGDMLIRDSAGR